MGRPKKADETVPAKELQIIDGLTKEQSLMLCQPTPKNQILKREGRGGMILDYISIGYVVDQLNKIFGLAWSFCTSEVSNMDMISRTGNIVVKGSLDIILKNGGSLRRENYGSSEVKFFSDKHPKAGRPVDIGDDFKSAAADALKKCASTIGIGADVYFRDWANYNGNSEKIVIGNEILNNEKEDNELARLRNEIYLRVKAVCKSKEEIMELLKSATGKDSFLTIDRNDIQFLTELLDQPQEARNV